MEGPMKNLFDPIGKVALVTGGTSGLGHAIAEAFLQNGVDVAVCSRHPESAPDLAELADDRGPPLSARLLRHHQRGRC